MKSISTVSSLCASAFVLVPLGGTILYLVKEFIRNIQKVRWLILSLYVFAIFHGLFLFSYFFLKVWFSKVEIAGWFNALALILSAPYLGIVFGLYYGLGASSASSGISATRILKDAALDNTENEQ